MNFSFLAIFVVMGCAACVSPKLKEYRTQAASLPAHPSRTEVNKTFPPLVKPEPFFVWSFGGMVTGQETYPIDDETELTASVWYHTPPPSTLQTWSPPQRPNDQFGHIRFERRKN